MTTDDGDRQRSGGSDYGSVEGIGVELEGGLLRLTLDRAEKKNALSDAMIEGLIFVLQRANNDDSVRAVLLRAEGKDFCVGADIVARNRETSVRRRAGSIQRRLPGAAHRLIPLITEVQVPIVAAVQGHAAGIGLHLSLACDFTIVADDAVLWEPFVARGFTPDSGATWLLPRLVGVARAREILMLGRRLDGRTAAAWGMVHRSVPSDQLEIEAARLAAELAAGPTVTLGLTKWLVNTGLSKGLEESLAAEGFAMEVSSRSLDFKEGMQAFAERRPPDFGGM